MTRKPASRPHGCCICHAPIPHAATGRPRVTCSDRCRQIKRRRNYAAWTGPRREAHKWRLAERLVRRLERQTGPISDAVPPIRSLYDWGLSPRRRFLIHFARRDYYAEPPPVLRCAVCRSPYLRDFSGATKRCCSPKCAAVDRRRRKALREALKQYADPDLASTVDPRVWVRVRLDLPLRACPHCGKPFPLDNPRRLYCSDRCRKAAWWRRNPRRRCEGCGVRFTGRRRFCSRSCSSTHWHRTATRCARCHHRIQPGAELLPNAATPPPHTAWSRRHREVYCSERCRDEPGWTPTLTPCQECGELFAPSARFWQRRQRFCSAQCRQRSNLRRTRQRRDSAPVRYCKHCGQNPLPRGRYSYCSPDCRRQGKLDYGAQWRARRRAP